MTSDAITPWRISLICFLATMVPITVFGIEVYNALASTG